MEEGRNVEGKVGWMVEGNAMLRSRCDSIQHLRGWGPRCDSLSSEVAGLASFICGG